MLKFLRKLLSPEVRQARRLLSQNSGTATEAFESAEKILKMVSYSRHTEIRMMRAGCLIEGMAKPHPDALKCVEANLRCLEEFGLIDLAISAVRQAAKKTTEEALAAALLATIPSFPAVIPVRVGGRLYRVVDGVTQFHGGNFYEQNYSLYGTSLRGPLDEAYKEYAEYLGTLGFEVEGRYARKSYKQETYQLTLMSSHA